ncbi:MAG: putative oxidoreductase/dehydrogenase, Rossmann-like domain [Humibacillus sp.]|nr:putative oxidoreductase/dehydrogenase, Rossmann-like domain [Humibacillus sp.]
MVSTPHERPARFDVGVVGAGRVGAVLGAALARAGHRVTGVSAVSEASLERAATLLPGVPVRPIPEVVSGAHLVVLAVPDDALADLVAGLSATGTFTPGQLVLHTSGAHGISVFESAVGSDIIPLALHPAMTFTGTALDLDRLQDCCFGVTTVDLARPLGEALVIEMGGDPVWVAEDDRVTYHAALAHGANHLVTLVAQSLQLLGEAGVADPARVLEPLLSAALSNTLRVGDAALTGPVARGDAGTVAGHVAMLRRVAPDVRPTYLALASATAQRALLSGRLRAAVAEPLLELLAHEEDET